MTWYNVGGHCPQIMGHAMAYMPPTFGNVFFVGSTKAGATTGNDGLTPASAISTLDAAIGNCTANNGDLIIGPSP